MKVASMRAAFLVFTRNLARSLHILPHGARDVIPTTSSRRTLWAHALLLAGILATLLIASYLMMRAREASQRDLEFSGTEIRLNIAARLNACAQILHSGAALFDASETVERDQWMRFVRSLQLDENLPGIQGVGYSQLILPGERGRHVEEVRSQGFPNYQLSPAGEREIYSSIVYLEPFRDRNLRAFGYDMFSEPVRRVAMERARDENSTALSGKVTLVQEIGREVQAGTLMYLPIYRHGMPIETVEQRRAAIQGWVYSPYRMADLMTGTLGGWNIQYESRPIYLDVFDGEILSEETLLYRSRPATSDGADVEAGVSWQSAVDVAGRRWTLRFTQAELPIFSYATRSVWLVLLGGITISALLYSLALALINTRTSAQRIARELTLELRDSKEKYRMVADFTYDWETWRQPDGNFKYVSPSCERITGHSVAEFMEDPELLLRITHPDDRTRLTAHFGTTAQADCEPEVRMDFRLQDAQGRLLWISHSSVVVHGENGRYLGRRESYRDISERKQAEALLQEEYTRLEGVIEGTRAGTWEWNVQTGEVVLNEMWARITGYTLNELAPVSLKTWEGLAHPEDLSKSRELLEKHFEGELPYYNFECRMRHKNGEWIWVHDRGRLISRTEDGEPLMMFGTHIDITERKRSVEQLRESEESYRNQFARNASIMLLVEPGTGRIVDANQAAVKFYGYPRERLLEMKIQEINILTEADIREAMDSVKRDEAKQFSFRHRLADGSIRNVEVSSSSIPFGDRVLLHSIVQDVTARKEAERSLTKARAHYQSLLDTASDGIHVIDLNGDLVEASASFYRMLGYPTGAPELRNASDWDAQWNLEELRERTLELMAIPAVFETRHRCRDGRIIDVEINARAIVIDGVPCLYASSRDVTERKKAEEEREKLQKELAEKQKIETVGELAGGIAHDFNNMIGIICGHADLAMGKLEPEHPLCFNLGEIRNAARRSADLTRQLLAFARRQVILPRPVDLNVVVSSVLGAMERRVGEHIHLNWRPGNNLWMVKSDATQIEQILTSLCANAKDAIGGRGFVEVGTENTTLDEEFCLKYPGIAPGQYVKLSVVDNGCGMDSSTMARVFEPFFTTKEFGHGTGLGLATVYGAVMQNNGCITVDSELNKGTTFSIFLPRMTGNVRLLEPESHHHQTTRGGEKILLVEDEPALLKLTTLLLEKQGYVVLPASTPAEAFRWVQEWGDQIQLLITDVVMPEMNGRDLAQEILLHYPKLKCLFMSGYTADIIADHGILAEGVAFIQKPFSMAAITVKVQECLGRAVPSNDRATNGGE